MSERAPSQIFVCRHGARLDASDSNWHLTSPTPYDPPLTYGGWTQARSLGNRIASLIVSQIASQYPLPTLPTAKPSSSTPAQSTWTPGANAVKEPVKAAPVLPSVSPLASSKLSNTKIVIHTSPFLRCVQTSIAVSAGMSQHFSDITVAPIESAVNGKKEPTKLDVHPKPCLRIDGFLGEWLCEDYFTDIIPPPAVSLMIGGAKLDLMRPSSASGLRKTHGANANSSTISPPPHNVHSHNRAHSVGFVPPIANSAVGKNDPIPRGHVSHAKEFCDVDYPYDSLKHGDGGEYGEEWGRMHKRVKIGFEQTIRNYVDGNIKPVIGKTAASFDQLKAGNRVNGGNVTDKKSIDGDTVLIFISHGAICNALIGAMTHQPVLLDMGIASMTMGVLKGETKDEIILTDPFSNSRRLSSGGTTYAPYAPPTETLSSSAIPTYDVKITASTDHLRSNNANLKSPVIKPITNPASQSLLRPRKQSVGTGGGFSMYNNPNRLPSAKITGLSPAFGTGKAMGMVFGGNAGGKVPVRRTASAAAATKGLWSRPTMEMEGHSSDEGAVTTDEESGEDKKAEVKKTGTVSIQKDPPVENEQPKEEPTVAMWGAPSPAPAPISGAATPPATRKGSIGGGLWNPGAVTDRRRRWTVTNQGDEGDGR